MPLNVIITGVGGQGNVLASQIVGKAAVHRDFNVTIGETFGLSQRGGPVMSHIRLSRDSSYGPLIPPHMAHIIIGLEPLETKYPETERIRAVLAESGGRLYWLDATRMAVDLGAPILLNMIMLGALCRLPDFPLEVDDFRSALKEIFPESKLEVNYRALDLGMSLVQENED
jgi:indolepyruvate ferredoxin oxidoreductase beta subunit